MSTWGLWRVEWTYCMIDGMRFNHHKDYKTEHGANKKKLWCEGEGFQTYLYKNVEGVYELVK